MRYLTHYIHKISPSDKDVGEPVDLSLTDLASRSALVAALRRAKILSAGDKIKDFRIEKDRVVVIPQGSIWHSIILHLPGTQAMAPKRVGPDTYQKFTLKPPHGKGNMRRFRSSSPVTWPEARDRLIAAGAMQSGWTLSVDPHDYIDRLAEALP